MRPTEAEVLRGIQGTLATYILPEVQTEHTRLEVMLVIAVLGAVAGELDGAAQRLVEDNGALRDLARRGADALNGSDAETSSLAEELRRLAGENDASVRLSELSSSNDRLHAAIGRLGALAETSDVPSMRELRSTIIGRLRAETESRALSLLGPRADG